MLPGLRCWLASHATAASSEVIQTGTGHSFDEIYVHFSDFPFPNILVPSPLATAEDIELR